MSVIFTHPSDASDSSKFTGIVKAKHKAPSLKGLEVNHTLQSEENFIEC